jgi:hypothetical protein
MAITADPATAPHRPAAAEIDARALARELAGAVRGEVRFSPGSRALYATMDRCTGSCRSGW